MTDQGTEETCKATYKITRNPFDLIGYDNPYDAQTLFPAFKVMIDMAHEGLLTQIDDDGGDILAEALQEAVKSHENCFARSERLSKEHYANNFVLSFFMWDELPDMELDTFKVVLAALSPFMGKPEIYNVELLQKIKLN